MPLGNYTYKPKNTSRSIELSDIEEFLLCLLKDICSSSSNVNLQNAVVNYFDEINLSDWQKNYPNSNILLSFKFLNDSEKNFNIKAKNGVENDHTRVEYQLGFLAKRDSTIITSFELLQAIEEVVNGATNNWNGTSSQPTSYQRTLDNGKVLKSDLTSNICDSFPDVFIEKEDTTQINYLTAYINILFTIRV